MYLTSWVPEYEELRTFAIERIKTLGVMDEHLAMRTLPPEPFANSIGAFSGRPDVIELEFDSSVADYVASREWHRSQAIEVRDDGSILLRLRACSYRPPRTRDPRLRRQRASRNAESTRARYLRRDSGRAPALHADSSVQTVEDGTRGRRKGKVEPAGHCILAPLLPAAASLAEGVPDNIHHPTMRRFAK